MNVPPAMSKTGADDSIAEATFGSPLKVAVKEPIGPKDGETPQTISQGKIPLTTKTATNSPQVKNHLLAFSPIVDKTWALIMALSTEDTVSKRTRPKTIKIMDRKSIKLLYNKVLNQWGITFKK